MVSLASLAVLSLIIVWMSLLFRAFYNVYLHPLRHYPGPKLWTASRLPLCSWNISGKLIYKVAELHQQYGDVVRVGPDELSYRDPRAWKDIYSYRQPEMAKSLKGHGHVPPANGVHGILTVPSKENHSRMRRTIAYAFSDRALGSQEKFLIAYVEGLIGKLGEVCTTGPVNMVEWFNFTTFDAIGDLAFGESFDCLTNYQLHPWVSLIFNSCKAIPYIQALQYYGLTRYLRYMMPKKLMEAREQNEALVIEKLQRRLEKGVKEDRGDFLSYVLRAEEAKSLSNDELQTLATTLIVGGSETTATVLSATTYYLLTHPSAYGRLTKEIREAFGDASSITLQKVGDLRYLGSVLEESLRMFPPTPGSLPRIVRPEGAHIAGRYVPGGTAVGVHQYSASRSPVNFVDPDSFAPERFERATEADQLKFAKDNRAALQPFSTGPRSCIGRTLAYAEMRLVMTFLLWHFDLKLAAGSEGWHQQQKTSIIWEKEPLMVSLASREP